MNVPRERCALVHRYTKSWTDLNTSGRPGRHRHGGGGQGE